MITSLHFKVPLGVIWACGLNPTSEVVRGLSRLFEAVFRKSCIWHLFIISGQIEAVTVVTSEATWGQKSKKCYFANFDGWTYGVLVGGERQG